MCLMFQGLLNVFCGFDSEFNVFLQPIQHMRSEEHEENRP